MPTYAYECKKCNYTFDVFQAMSDEPVKSCPKCGKEVRRLIVGGAGVIFKGSGFYVTDKAADKTAGKTSIKDKGQTDKATPTTGDSASTSEGDSKLKGDTSSVSKEGSGIAANSTEHKKDKSAAKTA